MERFVCINKYLSHEKILIPTTLQPDTITAIHSAIFKMIKICEIILLFASEVP
jgi:hypothetical protein